ncbi:DUF5605 domain-containing protein [Sinomonas sp. G460-2]|uniref:DUF5605 domain-containing protein n=1 Tax=Sinomonas sp. G460-2 TaxID=3393464 RepID=UPI0039F06B69
MSGYSPDSLLGDVLDDPGARPLIERAMPALVNSPLILQLRHSPVGQLIGFGARQLTDEEISRLWRDLAALSARSAAPRVEPRPIVPSLDYEGPEVARGSRRAEYPASAERWAVFEIGIPGPDHGNPFVDVDLHATFRLIGRESGDGQTTYRVGGFYDGAGRYVIRFAAPLEGEWEFVTDSTARSLDGLRGSFSASAPARAGNRGPVRVADTFHFRYADGTRYRPVGTTAYAWTNQPAELQERTLETLATTAFTKMRMCVFPKSYLFNANEPPVYPFERAEDGTFDTTRAVPAFFRNLERRIDQLAELGIEADLILFHAYDRWGFSDLGKAGDDRYVRYLVRRLHAFRNVWWSLANEYDLVRSKTTEDWERFAAIIGEEDPTGHLTSIHNCFGFYDYTRLWITHCSIQRTDVYRTSENTTAWREEFGKPIVIDECAYEGDIDQGWGNISGEELVRRYWEGAVRGGYVGHGETYLNDREELWWSKGGELVGDSPARIAFLEKLMAEAPDGVFDPLPSDWDVPWGGAPGHELANFGFGRPRYRDIIRKPGTRYAVDVIDTWNLSVERLPGTFEGTFRVPLPGRQYMAIRLTAARPDRADDGGETAGNREEGR